MRIGWDVHLAGTALPSDVVSPLAALARTRDLGLEGALFRTLYEITPSLDGAVLSDVADAAKDLDLYLEFGAGMVNPFMTAEQPHVRELGDGSYLAGMERMIEAAAAVDCHEIWTTTGRFKHGLPASFATDRFRTDTTWSDQLAATENFLRDLAPCLRHHGTHLNLETHEEITTFELVRLVEAVGDDALGITFDPANVVMVGEHPTAAARRIAPYVRMTHLRDVALCFAHGRLTRFVVPCGRGVIRWDALLEALQDSPSSLNGSIEAVGHSRIPFAMDVHEPRWLAAHPDLAVPEFAGLAESAQAYRRAVSAGDRPGFQELSKPDDALTLERFAVECADHLRAVSQSLSRDHASAEAAHVPAGQPNTEEFS